MQERLEKAISSPMKEKTIAEAFKNARKEIARKAASMILQALNN